MVESKSSYCTDRSTRVKVGRCGDWTHNGWPREGRHGKWQWIWSCRSNSEDLPITPTARQPGIQPFLEAKHTSLFFLSRPMFCKLVSLQVLVLVPFLPAQFIQTHCHGHVLLPCLSARSVQTVLTWYGCIPCRMSKSSWSSLSKHHFCTNFFTFSVWDYTACLSFDNVFFSWASSWDPDSCGLCAACVKSKALRSQLHYHINSCKLRNDKMWS